jgi:6-phosphogluconolactonase
MRMGSTLLQRASVLAATTAVAAVASAATASAASAPAPAPRAQTLYVSAFGEGAVRAFRLLPDGAIGPQLPGSPFKIADPMSEATVISPNGLDLYVTDRWEPGAINGFSIAPDGSLSPLPGSPYPTDGNFPVGLAFSPDGRHLYATNYNAAVPYTGAVVGPGSVKAYDVQPNGSLASVPGPSVFATGGLEPIGIVSSPDGRSLYVTHNSSGNVAVFAIEPSGGLKLVAQIPSGGSGSDGIAVAPDGSHLYIDTTTQIVTFALGPSGIPRHEGSPVSTGGEESIYLAMTRDGDRLWASNLLSGTVTGFAVAGDGSLTALPGGPTATGGLLSQAITFTPNMRYMYVANRGSMSTSAFSVAPDGGLSALQGSPFFTGTNGPGYSGETSTPGSSPFARLTLHRNGLSVRFSAAGSTDPESPIVRYDWSFGDRDTRQSAGPVVTHRYPHAGSYTVTVVLTDATGCSTAPGFTGRTTGCAGAQNASRSERFTVNARSRTRRSRSRRPRR